MNIYLKTILITIAVTIVGLLVSAALLPSLADAGFEPSKAICLGWRGFLNLLLPKAWEFRCPVLGAITTTSGNIFPKAFNNMEDDDIINAGDWNLLEYAIGSSTFSVSSSSNSTTSLYYLMQNAASVNPGHLHTTAGVSGTIAIAQGGTATTTFVKGLVMASGTDALSALTPGQGGSIPIASGTTWVSNVLTAGSNVTITTSTGSITIGATARFGGDDSDGAFTATTSVLSLGSEPLKVFNFTTLSITGTSTLSFSNPNASGTVIVIKVSGNATISCTSAPCIIATSTGGLGGTPGGDGGEVGFRIDETINSGGRKGESAGTGGSAYATTTRGIYTVSSSTLFRRLLMITPGSGGGGGTGAGGGSGGRGGGAVILEVAGTLTSTVTNAISVAGANGVSTSTEGGGGGGAGGMCLVLYNSGSPTLTCNDAGGNGGDGGGSGTGGGGGGHISKYGGWESPTGDNAGGGGANMLNAGGDANAGTAGTGAASTGGIITKNYWF